MLLELIGHGNLHGAVERQIAFVDAAQHLHRRLHHVVAFQHLVAEPGAGKLDLLRQGNFLLPGQQRNLAHLRQVHAHRIVGPRFVVLDPGQQIVGGDVQLGIVLFIVVEDGAVEIVLHVQRFDRVIHQIERLVGPRKRLVLQAFQQCVVQNAYSSGECEAVNVCVQIGAGTTLSHIPRPKAKKFTTEFPCRSGSLAIWQGISPAARIRSRFPENPNVPEPLAAHNPNVAGNRTASPTQEGTPAR